MDDSTYAGHYPYKSNNGYTSEPERNYDSDYSIKYKTLDRRRNPSTGSSYEQYVFSLLSHPEARFFFYFFFFVWLLCSVRRTRAQNGIRSYHKSCKFTVWLQEMYIALPPSSWTRMKYRLGYMMCVCAFLGFFAGKRVWHFGPRIGWSTERPRSWAAFWIPVCPGAAHTHWPITYRECLAA